MKNEGGRKWTKRDFLNYYRDFEAPTIEEGFSRIIKVDSPMKGSPKNALFLDLDGTVRYTAPGSEYDFPTRPEEVAIYEDVNEILRMYHRKGLIIVGVTNQSCVGRRIISEDVMQECLVQTIKLLEVPVAGVLYCPHVAGDNCKCRKPGPQMAYDAAERFDINLKDSIMVGDQMSDQQFAANAGIGMFLYRDLFFNLARAKRDPYLEPQA